VKTTEKRAAKVKAMQELVDASEERDSWTAADQAEFDRLNAEIRNLDRAIAGADDGTVDVRRFNGALTQVDSA
jgi:hypothetical protein